MIDADSINERKLDRVSSDQASSSRIKKPKRSNDPTPIQFFVQFPKGKILVFLAPCTDTVEFIHNTIMGITGIPTLKQRLIYQGKQLESEKTLEHYGIQRDATIQLVIGRMLSTDHPQAWQLTDDLVSLIFDVLKSNDPSNLMRGHHIIRVLKQFLAMTPMDNIEESSQHFQIFISSSAPSALVMLYISSDNTKKYIADESIHRFINSLKSTYLPKNRYNEYAQLVLEVCKLLRRIVGLDDPLYSFCRSSVGGLVEFTGIARRYYVTKELSALNDAFLFVRDVVVAELSRDLELIMGSVESTELSLSSTVRDFTEYMCLVRALLKQHFNGEYIESVHQILSDLHLILYDLLDKMELCLRKMEDQLGLSDEGRPIVSWWSQYLVILKELNNISKLFNNSEVFWEKISQRKASLCFLILIFAKSFDDYQWVIEHKEVTNFKVRRHLATKMLEQARCGDEEESSEMLIDRSQLLEEAFQYIVDVDPELLRGDQLMEFEHEEATGPGVLRQ